MACASLACTANAADEATTDNQLDHPIFRPVTLGLEAGTTGLGGSLSWRFMDHWGVRAGGDYFNYTGANVTIADIHYNSKLRLLSEPLTLDIYPWKKSSFRISAGIMFNQNQLTGDTGDTGTITIDGVPIPVELAGTLHMKVEQQLVNPYLSIGGNFFYFDHAHHWALGGELGVVYTGDPSVSVTRSGPPAPLIDLALTKVQQDVKDYAEKFMWWPVAKITVSYSF
jgi:hypothetical protein